MAIIEVRKITTKKTAGYQQYTITIPKMYGASLETLGINEFLVVLNSFGGVLIPITATMQLHEMKKQVLTALPEIEALLKIQNVGVRENES